MITKKFLDGDLNVHLNALINWDYDGSYDAMGMYEEAYQRVKDNEYESFDVDQKASFDSDYRIFNYEKQLIEEQNAYEADYHVNASVAYRVNLSDLRFELGVFANNIIGSDIRYYVSTGSTNYYPSRLKYTVEPTMIGLNLRFSY